VIGARHVLGGYPPFVPKNCKLLVGWVRERKEIGMKSLVVLVLSVFAVSRPSPTRRQWHPTRQNFCAVLGPSWPS